MREGTETELQNPIQKVGSDIIIFDKWWDYIIRNLKGSTKNIRTIRIQL